VRFSWLNQCLSVTDMLIRCLVPVPAVEQLQIPARCNMYCVRQSSCFTAYLVFRCVIVQLRTYRPPNVRQIPLQHPVCAPSVALAAVQNSSFQCQMSTQCHHCSLTVCSLQEMSSCSVHSEGRRPPGCRVSYVCTVQTWRSCVLRVPPLPPFFI
jgi:hypothetical protein